MCSISGIIRLTNSRPANDDLKAVVTRMNAAQRHRGPDDCGLVEVAADGSPHMDLCLGNTRLAILDTSKAGHQPMRDPESGNWITYNGETYNYRDLRSEIGNEFGPWRSNSDTEVVLRAYRKWGVQGFAKLRGMFAVAVWDQEKRELILARDGFGIKPLYCFFGPTIHNELGKGFPTEVNSSESISSGAFVFASELRALLASELVPRNLSSTAVSSFLEYGSVQAPLTIVEDVWSLMPGTCLRIRENSSFELCFDVSEFRSRPSHPMEPAERSRSQAKNELRSILAESVKQHLVSDVPLGVFLSGGMDSSAIVALMSQVVSDRPQTFSVIFDEANFSEAQHARAVAERFRTDHHEVKLSEKSLLEVLPDALVALDQPTMDGINSFIVSKAVKAAGITVALSGLGGDELFGGYPSFRRALRLSSTGVFARGMLRSLARFRAVLGNGSARTSKLLQLASSNLDPHDVYRISRQLFPPESIRGLSYIDTTTEAFRKPNGQNGETDPINAISQLELNGYMANTLLRDTDSMSMAHSLEVRVPFVDREVADYVLGMPGSWKIGPHLGNAPKPLLAEILSDLFPSELLTRRKMGFTLPFERWMTLQLRHEISSVLNDESQLSAVGFVQRPVLQLWNQFLQKPKAIGWSRPWSIYVLTKWCQVNNVKADTTRQL
jgi:asparagine synthase (glutamine-hydrolysing)